MIDHENNESKNQLCYLSLVGKLLLLGFIFCRGMEHQFLILVCKKQLCHLSLLGKLLGFFFCVEQQILISTCFDNRI